MEPITNNNNIDFATIIPRFDKILERGLSYGLGKQSGRMCIEAAICVAMDLPFGDEPDCVTKEIRDFKVCLNDSYWSNDYARAKGLRDLGIAQIGSKGVVDGNEFELLLRDKFVRVLIPTLLRDIYPGNVEFLDKAKQLEETGNFFVMKFSITHKLIIVESSDNEECYKDNINRILYYVIRAYANIHGDANKYLLMAAQIGLDVLKELKSPGCDWI